MLIQPLPPIVPGRIRESNPVSQTFQLPGQNAAAGPRGPASTAGLASLQTMLAIQEVSSGPVERRRQALRRGEEMLNELGRLQRAMLGDGDGAGCLERLQAVLADPAALAEEAGLDQVLVEIELRAAVEVAKRERRP